MIDAHQKKVAVIGAGNMGEAIVRGLVRATTGRSGFHVTACDAIADKLRALQSEVMGAHVEQNPAHAVQHADIVILATKPADIHPVLQSIRAELQRKKEPPLVLSVAAGIRMAELKFGAGENARVVRCMPNLPATIGAGITAVYAESDADWELSREILGTIGDVVRLGSESQIDAATALSASGPAFICLVLEALGDGGVKAGLSRESAQKLALGMFSGTASYLEKTGIHPAVLRERVSSPGGTTIAGLAKLEQAAVRAAFISAIDAAAARATELGKSSGALHGSAPQGAKSAPDGHQKSDGTRKE